MTGFDVFNTGALFYTNSVYKSQRARTWLTPPSLGLAVSTLTTEARKQLHAEARVGFG